MRTFLVASTVASVAFLLLAGCETAPTTAADRAALDQQAAQTVARFKHEDPGLEPLFGSAAGYAVFPSVGQGAAGIGGAYGRGELFEHAQRVGFCDISQGTLGFQLGGQAFDEVIFFENQAALNRFKLSNFAFTAAASAVALKSGCSGNAKYADGVMVFTATDGGLMFEASLGGQKFSYLGN